jgi:hypothetical protein
VGHPLKTWLSWLAWCVVCCAATLVLAKSSWSHELHDNRLTLVMRDATHVSLTYFIDYPSALHRALAPQQTEQQFVLTHSAMPAADFQKALLKAQAKFSSGTRLAIAKNKGKNTSQTKALTLTNWQWPDAKSAQTLLQQRAMQTLVGAGEHALEMPFEVRAEATATQAINSLDVRLPEEMGKVLVVSYRPLQAWADAKGTGLVVRF